MKERNTPAEGTKKIMKGKASLPWILSLVAVTAVVFSVYRFFLARLYFEITLIVYMTLLSVLVFGYIIYNRGMSRRGVTPEMLPEDWSDEKKTEFLADGERRLRRSRWMLVPIFAFLFTFAFDMMELYVVPFFKDLIG